MLPAPLRYFFLTLCLAVSFAPSSGWGQMVINEIHFNPDVKTEPVEFIELHNAGTSTVNLSGWRLTNAVTYSFPAGTQVLPGGFVVVAQNPAALQSKYGVVALGPWQGKLSNEGDKISLRDAAGTVQDEVNYQIGFPWPTVGDAPGYSIELIHPGLDNDLGGSWRASRLSTAPSAETTLIGSGSTWRYFKGITEASTPTTLWRSLAFDDTAWSFGAMPIGYDASLPMATPLADMTSNYTTVFLRSSFVVTNLTNFPSLFLDAVYDDGFKVWINGVNVLNANVSASEVPFTGTSASTREDNSWTTNSLPNPSGYLVEGTNIIAIQLVNTLLSGSSDCFLNLKIRGVESALGLGPTPGRTNAVFATNAPPQIRQVDHSPSQPKSGQSVLISARVTDPHGVTSVTLEYQIVNPGSYIELTDAEYASNWTSLPMNDAGTGGDLIAGDSTYSATLPGGVQQHRRLIRYRIVAQDATGLSIRVPYVDDPQPNFACFVYDSIPAWSGAVKPGDSGALGQAFTVSSNEMARLPVYHLIAKRTTVETATWFSRYGGDAYLWSGTLVYDGKVYDHIHYRARGGVWRYAMGKNMWKFDFNRGHDFEPRDNWGKKYSTSWRKLNLGASIQQGNFNHRGEQGLFESIGMKLFQLSGIAAPHTSYVQFRIIDEADEINGASQWDGDFWGVYLALEQEDGQFLDEHNLPDSNYYKMESGTGELNNVGPNGPTDKSDLNYFIGNYTGATEAWWRTNLNIPAYLNYQTIVQAIHHYDICDGKNYFYYHNSSNGLWQVVPWDLDLTWAENMYNTGCGGTDAIKSRLLPNATTQPAIWREWQNRIREVRDLLLNEDEGWRLVDEFSGRLRGPGGGPTLLDADRAQWDYNPRMTNSAYSTSPSGKAGHGRFYQWPGYPPEITKDFNGAIQLMKNYLLFRSTNSGANPRPLDTISADALIPSQPTITYTGQPGFPVNRLSFRSSVYSGAAGFKSMKWRVGEITKATVPSYLSPDPWLYEIEPVWESGDLATFNPDITVPPGVLRVGRVYRARVQFKDVDGRTSHWSPPVEFTGGTPDNAAALIDHLRITELMFKPPEGSDYEFLEILNTSASTTLDLAGVRISQGVDFTFPPGAQLAPGTYAMVVRASATGDYSVFRNYYGVTNGTAIFGPYTGSFSDGGETVTIRSAINGPELISFDYADSRVWPIAADGSGHSLVPLPRALAGQTNGSLSFPGNWRASSFIKGSPGRVDPPIPDAIVLNEIVAHTDFLNELDSNDWIELNNRASTNFTFGANWFLSDSAGDLRKWMIPAGTVLPGNGFVVFDEVTGFHNPITIGFGLTKSGEQVFLSYLPGDGSDRVVDAVRFPAEENDWSWGRAANAPDYWVPLTPRTRGQTNGVRPVVPRVTEIHYNPAPLSGSIIDNTNHEFIEITAPAGPATVFSNTNGTWRLNGDISFDFPTNFTLVAGQRVLTVSFSPTNAALLANFKSAFGITNSALPVLGPYQGKLSNRSGRITLEKPQAPDLPGDPIGWILVDETVFADQAPWTPLADATGWSLQLLVSDLPGSDDFAWIAALPGPGSATTALRDTDGDGAPDVWEQANAFDPFNSADAWLDSDGDGASNGSEYFAGTNPHDPASVLRLRLDRLPPNPLPEISLKWLAFPSRYYDIEHRTVFGAQPWQTISNLSTSLSNQLIEVRLPATNQVEGYFRVRVHP